MKFKFLSLALAVALTGCGGGSSGSSSPSVPAKTSVSGSGVKGPLAGAVVKVYQLNAGVADLKGNLLGTGATNSQAAITGLSIASAITGPLLVEFTADADTTDITTNAAPVITRMTTVRDAALLTGGAAIYATPLSTLAVDLAQRNADKSVLGYSGDNSGTITEAEFLAALPVAAAQVKSSFGFGLLSGIDILGQAPLITEQTTDAASQIAVLNFRTAVEAIAAVARKLETDAGSGVTTEQMFLALAEDLSDGVVDGQNNGVQVSAMTGLADVATSVTVDPSTLVVPGTTTPVTGVSALLVAEAATTGVATDTTEIDGDTTAPAQVKTSPDSDADGVVDTEDAFPMDAGESVDTDGDGVGDNADIFPTDPTETLDTDVDGVGNNADAFPTDPTETLDTDGDGVGNNADIFPSDPTEDADTDSDGVGDNADAFPIDPTETTDTDGDGVGDNSDIFPNEATETLDSDGDGFGDNSDAFPGNPGEWLDSDSDGVGDNADAFPTDATEIVDTDGDGVGDNADAFPSDPAESVDADGDGYGDSVADSNPLDSCVPDNTVAACPGTTTSAVWDNFNWNEANWQ